jgi:DME family drug/metabolite transporter
VRAGRRWAASTALAGAGVALLALAGAPGAAASPAGVALALGAGAGYATYAVVAKRLLRAGHAPAGVMGAAFGGGALLLLPVLALTDTAWLATGEGAAVVLYLGVVPTALAYVLFACGLRRLSAAETTTLVLAEPVTAALLGTLVLGERLGPGAALGGALVLAGLVALAAPARPARARAPRPEAAG